MTERKEFVCEDVYEETWGLNRGGRLAMTQEQEIIERNEFGCEDGHKALTKVRDVLRERARGDLSVEAIEMREALTYAAEVLEDAAEILSKAYDKVGAWEKATRRKKSKNATVLAYNPR